MKDLFGQVLRGVLKEGVDWNQFDMKVSKPDYKGVIKRDAQGWYLCDENGKREDEDQYFSTFSSLIDYYDIEKAEISGEYAAKHLKRLEEKKPSAGLSNKQKSAVAKKAVKGEDIGKKGKGFDKVAAKAAKEYGSAEKGEKVAAAAMWKNIKR